MNDYQLTVHYLKKFLEKQKDEFKNKELKKKDEEIKRIKEKYEVKLLEEKAKTNAERHYRLWRLVNVDEDGPVQAFVIAPNEETALEIVSEYGNFEIEEIKRNKNQLLFLQW